MMDELKGKFKDDGELKKRLTVQKRDQEEREKKLKEEA